MISKNELLKQASKEEVNRVSKKLQRMDQTLITLLSGEVKIISKEKGRYIVKGR